MQSTQTNLMTASREWANRPADQRFETLQALRDKVHARRMVSRAVEIDVSNTQVVTRHDGELETLIIEGKGLNGSGLIPTHWSFNQMAGRVKAPATYLRTLPPELVADNLNHGLKTMANEDRGAKFLTVAEEELSGFGRLQAVTSPTYGRIWDADVADAAMRIVERSGGKFFNPRDWSKKPSGLYASDHDVFIFMIDGGSIVAGPRGEINRGFFLWNSETGAKTFGLTTFLFNQVCGNHIIWGARDVNTLLIRHSSGGPTRFDQDAVPTLKRWVEASALPLEATIKRASEMLLPLIPVDQVTVKDLIDFTAKAATFTKTEMQSAIDFAKSEEGECRTLWQLVQGLTAYARGFEWIDARVDIETRAGKVLAMADATLN